MRALTTSQLDTLAVRNTKPVYLVELFITSEEYYSTNGDRVTDSKLFVGSDLGLSSIDNWQSANIKLRPEPWRVTQVINQDWRHGSCKIYLLPSADYPFLMPPGYVEEGYAAEGLFTDEPILLLDGQITGANYNADKCEFTVSHVITVGRWIPALRIDPPLCNHLPRPGEIVVWENEKFTLEAR